MENLSNYIRGLICVSDCWTNVQDKFFKILIVLCATTCSTAFAMDCSDATASPNLLWPPNHKMAAIKIEGIPGADQITIQCISQDEPTNTNGDGNTEYDATGEGSDTALVRQERVGGGNGRVYHIGFLASNESGENCTGVVKVGVPPSKNKSVTDDGPLYSSSSDTTLCDGGYINKPPVIHSLPVKIATVTRQYQYDVEATDPEGDALVYALTSSPEGMEIDAATGLIQWTPSLEQEGQHEVSIYVVDEHNGSTVQTYNLTVNPLLNSPPIITSTPISQASVGLNYQYPVIATDPDGDILTYVLNSFPEGMSISSEGLINWIPTNGQVDEHSISLSVYDGRGGVANQTYTITVPTGNNPPVILSEPVPQAWVNEPYNYKVIAEDADGDELSYQLTLSPSGMSISSIGEITWIPELAQAFDHTIEIQVSDGRGGIAIQNYVLTVTVPNHNPIITSLPALIATTTQEYSYQVLAEDQDNDPLDYTLLTSPQEMQISEDGLIIWTPAIGQVGSYKVIVLVTDGRGGSANQSYTIGVTERGNTPPVFTSTPLESILVGKEYHYNVIVEDAEGDDVEVQLEISSVGMELDQNSNVLAWTPTVSDLGVHDVTLKAIDTFGASSHQVFQITVSLPNRAPVITSQAVLSVNEDELYQYDVEATDPDGDIIQYSLNSAPDNMSIDPLSGLISWSPNTESAGSYPIAVKASDPAGLFSTQSYTLVVSDVNRPPTANAQSLSTNEDTSLNITLTGTDADNDSLNYSLVTQTSKGALTGTAPNLTYQPNQNFNGTDSFSFKVNDGALDSTVVMVTIKVLAQNDPPVIISVPVYSVTEGDTWTYTLEAIDPDISDTLTLSAPILPSGVSFDSQSGDTSWPTIGVTPGNYNFNFEVHDNDGAKDVQSFVVAVVPLPTPNISPIANAGGDQTVNEQTTVMMSGAASTDSDGSITSYLWTQSAGTPVTIKNANSSLVSFIAPTLTTTETLTFVLTVTDNDGASSSDSISIFVEPVNLPPNANAGPDQNVYQQTTVNLDGTGSTDIDGVIVSYAWVQTGGIDIIFDAAPDFTAPVVNSTQMKASLFADNGIENDNFSGEFVSSIACFNCGQEPPTSRAQSPSFTSPSVSSVQKLIFELTVTDNEGASDVDLVEITVYPAEIPNTAPSANAGVDQNVEELTTVNLDGSASKDNDGTIASYAWAQTAGIPVSLTNTTTAILGFIAPVVSSPESLSFELTVTDNDGASAVDAVVITVYPAGSIPNILPTVDAGEDRTVEENTTVYLGRDAHWSDADGSVVSLDWVQTSGAAVMFLDGTPNFTAPAVTTPEILTFELTVTDNQGGTAVDSVAITIIPAGTGPNMPPTIGSDFNEVKVVQENTIAYLDGSSATDSDGTIVSYNWVQTRGETVEIINADTATAHFTAPAYSTGVSLAFAFTVTDDDGATAHSTAYIQVQSEEVYTRPVADPGYNQLVYEQSTVNLDGTGSYDNDGTIASYHWRLANTSGPLVTIINPETATPKFTAPAVDSTAMLVFEFWVTDNDGKVSWSQFVEVTVKPVAGAPEALAQTIQTTQDQALNIILNGTDPNQDSLSYIILDEPANGSLSGEAPNITYYPDNKFVGTETIRFIVNDGFLDSTPATITINVTPDENSIPDEIDITGPFISLIGNKHYTYIERMTGFAPLSIQATAYDDTDGAVTVGYTSVPELDFNTPGTYEVTYTAQDKSGNVTTSAPRTIEVIDYPWQFGQTDIYMSVPDLLFVPKGAALPDLDEGVTADSAPGAVVPRSGIVDTDSLGHYPIIYSFNDGYTTYTRTRYVIVYEPNPGFSAANSIIPKTAEVDVFSYFDDGYIRAGADRNYTRDNETETVTDAKTGLIWEDSAHVSSTPLSQNQAEYYCSELTIGNNSDWRLPTSLELLYLVNFDRTGQTENSPKFDLSVFNHIASGDYDAYWVRETGKTVSFIDGSSELGYHYNYVRCVSGEEHYKPDLNHLSINDAVVHEVVHDTNNKLMWQDSVDVVTNRMSWSNAIHYCEALTLEGFTDWRLPNINEAHSALAYLFNESDVPFQHYPVWESFPASPYLWTASTSQVRDVGVTPIVARAWVLLSDFLPGSNLWTQDNQPKHENQYVRCVRNYKDSMIPMIAGGDRTVLQGELVHFDGSGSVNTDGVIESYQWLLLGDNEQNVLLSNAASFSKSDFSPGIHEIVLYVKDDFGLIAETQVTLTVLPQNQAPDLVIKTPVSDASFTAGKTIIFTATANDPEDGDISSDIIWSSDIDGTLGAGSSLNVTTLSVGTHTITATIADSGSATDVSNITITVSPNAPPSVVISTPSTGTSFIEGNAITFTGSATDPEDGDISGGIIWSSNIDGTLGTGSNLNLSTLSVGSHTITATITDSGSTTDVSNITVIITPNAPPSVVISTPSTGTSFIEGSAIVFTGSATDAEDGDISGGIIWSSNIDGTLGTATSLNVSTLSVGSHTITATITDSGSATDASIITISITPNTAPSVVISTPTNGASYTEGNAISFTGSASDAEDGDISSGIIWSSDIDGTLGTGGSLNLSTLSAGTHTITAAIADSGSATDVSSITITVTPNALPTVLILTPTTGDSYTEGNSITFTGSASDAEDGDISSSLTWSSDRDGILGTGSNFNLSSLSVGRHIIDVAATDSNGASGMDTIVLSIDYAMHACPTIPVEDDSNYVDIYPSDNIAWVGTNYSDVKEIEKAFNHARSIDNSVFEYLKLPNQTEWDAMSVQAKGLYLVNSERQARRIKPYEGVSQNVVNVAQAYSDYIITSNSLIDHYLNGSTPTSRLESDPEIQGNSDFNQIPESLFANISNEGTPSSSEAVVQAIYFWMYHDKTPLYGQAWGHRDQLVQTGYDENYGVNDKEGLLGFGVSLGNYDPYQTGSGSTGAVVVLNTIDQSSSWSVGITETVNTDGAQLCNFNNVIDLDASAIPNVDQLVELKLAPSDILLATGETTELSVIGVFQDDSEQDLSSVAYFTADTRSVVSIESGIVTGLLSGHTNIVAQVNGITSNTVLVEVGEPVDTTNLTGTAVDPYLGYIPDNATLDHYDPSAFSIYTGVVNDRYGYPIEGVTISVLNASGYGSVETDNNGRFVLPVGSGSRTLVYRKQGYVTVHRSKISASGSWTAMDDVILLEVDSKQTDIDLTSGIPQVHTSSIVTDQFGSRSATLVFNGVSSATVTLPNGTKTNLASFAVRATEYEMPESMPADLPIETAFTYCTEREIVGVRDDAEVVFNGDVVMYVDNFLGFAVGEIIPVGYYDRQKGAWEGSENGIVVKLLDSNSDGLVDGLDYTGDDIADDLNGNSDTTDEVAGIENFAPGQTYWRGSSNHFSPFDYNLSSALPADAQSPGDAQVDAGKEDEKDGDCVSTASFCKPMQQSFHEDISVTGTGQTLHYSSQRTADYKHKINAKVTGGEIPASLIGMVARLEIGGNVYEQNFAPALNQYVEFIWDGNDPYGTRINGFVEGQLSIGYKYSADYTSVGNIAESGVPFNDVGVAWAIVGENSTGIEGRQDLINWNRQPISLQNTFESQLANGWSLSNYHQLSPDGNVYKGDGTVMNDYKVSRILKTGINVSHYPKDDGDYQKGGSSINYAVTNEGILKDQVTGLEWEYTTQPAKFRTKAEAQNYCANSVAPANSGWRLPTAKEQVYSIDKSSSQHDFAVYTFEGIGYWSDKTYNPDNQLIPVICVRGETINTRYVADIKRNNIDEVVVDTANGLMWQDDGSASSVTMDWESSIDYCEAATFGGYDNWRLPNINELAYVLPNDVFVNQATYPGSTWSPANSNINPYWSSTPNFQYEGKAWAMQSESYYYHAFDKSAYYHVRCVRDDNSALGGAYQFDQHGKHLKTIDINTGSTLLTFSHNAAGLLSSITDRFGNVMTINRNFDGVVTSIQSEDGYVTQLNIDGNNNLASVRYDDNSQYQFTYVGTLMTLEIDRNDNQFGHKFDENGRVYETSDPEDGIWTFYSQQNAYGDKEHGYITSEGNTNLSNQSVLSNGNIQTISIDTSGLEVIRTRQSDNLLEISQSYGTTTVVNRVIDPKTKDEIPSSITTTLPSGLSKTSYITKSYAENGANTKKETVTTTQNNKTSTIFTDYGTGERTVTSPESRVTTSWTDPATGLLQKVQPAGLFETSYTYDGRGRVETVTTGTRTRTYHYNDSVGKGKVTSIESPDGKHTAFTYDNMGRTDIVTYSDNRTTDTDLDNNNNTTKVAIPSSGNYGFTYNSVDRVTSETSPLVETTRYQYDRDRNLTLVTFPSTKQISHTYANGLLDYTTTPEGVIDYSYTQYGSQVDVVSIGSESIDYNYDGTLLTGITYQGLLDQSISQSYNADWLIGSLHYAGSSTSFGYDDDGILNSIGNYTISLNPANTLPEGLSDGSFVQNKSFNGYGEVDSVGTQVNNQDTYDYSLTYNDLGQIVTKQEILHDGTVNNYVYTYHPDRRWLTTVTKNGAVIESYAYDANGNRTLHTNTERSINGKVSTYNIADQITSDGHIYNVDGYLSEKTINGVTTHYEYSSRGQLLSVQTPGKHITYKHNAMGNRVAKLVDGAITEKYLWQDMTTLLAVYNPDNSLKQRFEYTLGNTPTSFTESGQKYYIVSDHLGSPRVITDSNGAVIKAYSYDAFGNRSTLTDNDPSMEIPFGFAGGLYDTDTGLNRFGFRDYDAETGRWTARDPIGLSGGINVYGYVNNDPINLIDSTGLCAEKQRTWGSYLPGTEAGDAAAQFWANIAVNSDHPLAPLANIPGVLAALWTEQTAASTTFTLGTAGLGPLVQGLKNLGGTLGAITFRTGHYAPRLEAAGLNVARTESLVAREVGAVQPNLTAGAGFGGRINVNNVTVEYRAMPMPNGSVSVGTIFPVK